MVIMLLEKFLAHLIHHIFLWCTWTFIASLLLEILFWHCRNLACESKQIVGMKRVEIASSRSMDRQIKRELYQFLFNHSCSSRLQLNLVMLPFLVRICFLTFVCWGILQFFVKLFWWVLNDAWGIDS